MLGVNKSKIFYSSSACIYPEENQLDPLNPNCAKTVHTQQIQIPNMVGKTIF